MDLVVCILVAVIVVFFLALAGYMGYLVGTEVTEKELRVLHSHEMEVYRENRPKWRDEEEPKVWGRGFNVGYVGGLDTAIEVLQNEREEAKGDTE